jgi:hypothetical protein
MKCICHGFFSVEIVRTLNEAIAQQDKPSLFPCARCGRYVRPENECGQWIPSSHHPAFGNKRQEPMSSQ